MSHCSELCDWLFSVSDEERESPDMKYIPLWVCWAQLWDMWDFVTWPIRRLRAALSHQEAGL
jgi:hypothetical protein